MSGYISTSEIGNKLLEEEAQVKAQEEELKKQLEALTLKRLELKSKRKPLTTHIKKLVGTKCEEPANFGERLPHILPLHRIGLAVLLVTVKAID